MRVTKVLGVGAAAGIATAYRGAKGVAKQNSPFRRAWENHNLRTLEVLDARAQAGLDLPFIYVALGDSAAQGLGARCIEEGYVARIAAGLETALGRDVALLNLSLSGGTIESVRVTQLAQLAGLRIGGKELTPDLVTLDIGGNDVGLKRLEPERFDELTASVCADLGHPAFVANIPTFEPLRTAARGNRLSEILSANVEASGATLIDLHSVSRSMSLTTYMRDYHAADLFHPNSRWYARWAQLFLDEICRHFGLDALDEGAIGPWSGAARMHVE